MGTFWCRCTSMWKSIRRSAAANVPETSPCSLRAGRRVTLDTVDTIADGLRAAQPGELTFEVNRRLLADVAAVDEAAIVEAMRFCFARLKVVVEPSGAVPLAALLTGAVRPGGRTAVVLSGGNVDPADFAALLRRAG